MVADFSEGVRDRLGVNSSVVKKFTSKEGFANGNKNPDHHAYCGSRSADLTVQIQTYLSILER